MRSGKGRGEASEWKSALDLAEVLELLLGVFSPRFFDRSLLPVIIMNNEQQFPIEKQQERELSTAETSLHTSACSSFITFQLEFRYRSHSSTLRERIVSRKGCGRRDHPLAGSRTAEESQVGSCTVNCSVDQRVWSSWR